MDLPEKFRISKEVLFKDNSEMIQIRPIFARWAESEDLPENSKLERVVELMNGAWVCTQNWTDYISRFTRANSDLTFVAIHNTKLVGNSSLLYLLQFLNVNVL